MAESTRIEDVRERVRDFSAALRQAGAEDVASRIDGYASGFVDGAQVRRSVDAIRQQLRYFRAYPEELPELPVVQIAANRLEDACKEVLREGVIAPARLSLRAQGKRKLSVMLTTLLAAGLVLALPFGLVAAGVDVGDLRKVRDLPTLQLKKGSFEQLEVSALEPALIPAATSGVELLLAADCPGELGRGMSCTHAGEKSFGSRKLRSYEVMLPEQAYGITVGFGQTQLLGAVGRGELLVSASLDTPEGHYVVPLSAAFVGYTPARCNLILELSGACTKEQRGAHARHEGVRAPTLHVQVVAAGPQKSSAELQAEQAAAERARAEQRAAQLASAVEQIQAVLDDTHKQLRKKRYDLVQERIDKLTKLFEPLDALAVAGAEGEPLPAEVVGLRARFEQEQQELRAFRERAFETAYKALTGPRSKSQSDDAVLASVAKRLGISTELMDQIYAEHAEVLEERALRAEAAKERAKQAKEDAILARCGVLPKAAWREVDAYLRALAERKKLRIRMHECLTPRLSEKTCWSVVCDFEEIQSSADTLLDQSTKRRWTFRLQGNRVVEHQTHSVPLGSR